ncbi:MAG: CocE/NonD family hydrolase [Acutalibacteraceae bacterium]|nr:CocE/NonD family hydrolase [Acutalibacteraceae bacterium]
MKNQSNVYAYFEYLNFNAADLFTVVCRPKKEGTYPTVITRSPYVDADELLSEEEICQNRLNDFLPWVERGYVVIIQHCRGRGKSTGDCIPYIRA